jgi:hypothetical protein
MKILLTPICWFKEFWRTISNNAWWSGHDFKDLEYIPTKKGGTIISECIVCGKKSISKILDKGHWDNFLLVHGVNPH